jgi:hypothetical protein
VPLFSNLSDLLTVVAGIDMYSGWQIKGDILQILAVSKTPASEELSISRFILKEVSQESYNKERGIKQKPSLKERLNPWLIY